MPNRQVFYSFHYGPDNWRAAQVRSIGVIDGNRPASDNDWETVKSGGNTAIKNWIEQQMRYRSCTVVLIGNETANRRWINHEIIESWNRGMGVVGIDIHGLLNRDRYIAHRGENPFDYINLGQNGIFLSTVVKRYNPPGSNSRERYAWIARYLSDAVEEAINIRNSYTS